jgi:hypothetical protein
VLVSRSNGGPQASNVIPLFMISPNVLPKHIKYFSNCYSEGFVLNAGAERFEDIF